MKARAAAAAAVVALLVTPAYAGRDDDFADATVLFARDASLWRTDPRGKGPAVEVVRLPAAQPGAPAPAHTVRAIRVDAALRTLVVDVGGLWYWTRLPATGVAQDLAPMPCTGPVRLTADGTWGVCATAGGKVAIYCFAASRPVVRDVAASGAIVIDPGRTPPTAAPAAVRELIWADSGGVWAAPQGRPAERRKLASHVPLRGFSPAPNGRRAVGVFRDTVTHRGKPVERDQLFSFALDGAGVRRKIIREGLPVDWSWNSEWLLVQDGSSACVMRAVGGEYKCWKGYTAVSIAPDGSYALLLGRRGGTSKDDDERVDEAELPDGEAATELPAEVVPLPTGALSLYRARLAGAYTERPSLVERVVDGAAAWLAPYTPVTPALAAPPAAPSGSDSTSAPAGASAPVRE